MDELRATLARLASLWRSIPRPRLRSRTVLVLIPLHVLAFAALYSGMMRIINGEILRAHSRSARLLLRAAVRDLQPAMCTPERAQIPAKVAEFASNHALLDLRVYRRDGTPLSQPGGIDPDIRAFLLGPGEDRFLFDRSRAGVALHGILRIRSAASCVGCHPAGEELGAATMLLDLTSQVGSAQAGLRRNLALLIAGWTLAVGLFNLGFATWTKRSLARMHDGQLAGTVSGSPARIPKALLDPVAAEIYESLSRLIRERQRRDDALRDRLHHTDRLASLGQLAAGLAHEIKNPLAGVRGVIELMRDETDDEGKRSLYEQIVAELDRVNGTIHSLLNFARPSQTRRESADVAELLESSLQLLRPSLAQRSIELQVDVARDVGTFSLDRAKIRQVLTNLVSNAAEAIGKGGRINVRASRFPQGSGLIISVHDDGPGIPADVRPKLFEPFFTTKLSGTGLGLSVVHALVHQHGGRVELQSEVGQGSTFFVLLPEPDASADSAAAGAGPADEV